MRRKEQKQPASRFPSGVSAGLHVSCSERQAGFCVVVGWRRSAIKTPTHRYRAVATALICAVCIFIQAQAVSAQIHGFGRGLVEPARDLVFTADVGVMRFVVYVGSEVQPSWLRAIIQDIAFSLRNRRQIENWIITHRRPQYPTHWSHRTKVGAAIQSCWAISKYLGYLCPSRRFSIIDIIDVEVSYKVIESWHHTHIVRVVGNFSHDWREQPRSTDVRTFRILS